MPNKRPKSVPSPTPRPPATVTIPAPTAGDRKLLRLALHLLAGDVRHCLDEVEGDTDDLLRATDVFAAVSRAVAHIEAALDDAATPTGRGSGAGGRAGKAAKRRSSEETVARFHLTALLTPTDEDDG